MGNTQSQTEESTASLRSHLSKLETQVHNLEASFHHPYFAWPNPESSTVELHPNDHLENPDVHIVLGPVVGKVTHNSCIMLLEVDSDTEITCVITAVDSNCPQGRIFKKQKSDFTARRPQRFILTDLEVDTQYLVSFSGISKEQSLTKVARFRTWSVQGPKVKLAVVSGDNPYELNTGDRNMWESVVKEISQNHNPVQLVLHIGGQVFLQKAFLDAWNLVLRHSTSALDSHVVEEDWKAMEERAYEILREAYLLQWNLPHTQVVLANSSNLMIWNEKDIFPGFTTTPEFTIDRENPTKEMSVVRSVLRAARRAYHCYQRQLWDEDLEATADAEKAFSEKAEKQADLALQASSLNMVIARREAILFAARNSGEYERAKEIDRDVDIFRDRLKKVKESIEANTNDIIFERGEEFACVFDNIAVIMLDMRGNRLLPDGSQAGDNPLLSDHQWRYLEELLSQKGQLRAVNILIVASELPLFDVDPNITRSLIPRSPAHEGLSSWWSSFPAEQLRLIETLSDWCVTQPNRSTVFVAGGTGRGFKTTIYDRLMRIHSQQLTVGPITAAPSQLNPFPISERGCLDNRFEYTHKMLPPVRNFGVIELDAGNPKELTINADHCVEFTESTWATVGPVVGLVTDCTVGVLLEVNETAPVTCILTNSIDRSTHREQRVLQKNIPHVFRFTRLAPEQEYSICFVGIQNADLRRGSFKTMCSFPKTLNVALVCRDGSRKDLSSPNFISAAMEDYTVADGLPPQPPIRQKLDTSEPLWSTLTRGLAMPFGNIDMVLHLGGQVQVKDSVGLQSAIALLVGLEHQRNGQSLNIAQENIVELAKDSLRNIYRYQWNLPQIREALSHGCHIMMPSDLDLGKSIDHLEYGTKILLQQLLHEVCAEYQGQISSAVPRPFDHTSRGAKSDYSLHQEWGHFGLFMLDIQTTCSEIVGRHHVFDSRLINAEQWEALGKFLGISSLKTCIISSSIPFVDNSIDDAQTKAEAGDKSVTQTFPYHSEDLLRLVSLLMHWKSENLGRQVLLVSGSVECGGMETTIVRHLEDYVTLSIKQYVVGPIYDKCDRQLIEPKGSLDTSTTYEHVAKRSGCEIGYLRCWQSDESSLESLEHLNSYESLDSVNEAGLCDFVEKVEPLPKWLEELHGEEEENDKLASFLDAKDSYFCDEYEKLDVEYLEIQLHLINIGLYLLKFVTEIATELKKVSNEVEFSGASLYSVIYCLRALREEWNGKIVWDRELYRVFLRRVFLLSDRLTRQSLKRRI